VDIAAAGDCVVVVAAVLMPRFETGREPVTEPSGLAMPRV
jgi:hypothetical protein